LEKYRLYSILNQDSRKKLKTEKIKKKLKTQEKTQNSSQKLKNSAFLRPLHAEKMAKKPACLSEWKSSLFAAFLHFQYPPKN